MVVEANAIGTTYLRAQLLVPEIRVDALPLLRDYLDVRIRASAVSVIREEDRNELLTESPRIQSELWTLAGHRASFVTYVMVALIALLVFVIIDLVGRAAV